LIRFGFHVRGIAPDSPETTNNVLPGSTATELRFIARATTVSFFEEYPFGLTCAFAKFDVTSTDRP
jgi:hypothetical protein